MYQYFSKLFTISKLSFFAFRPEFVSCFLSILFLHLFMPCIPAQLWLLPGRGLGDITNEEGEVEPWVRGAQQRRKEKEEERWSHTSAAFSSSQYSFVTSTFRPPPLEIRGWNPSSGGSVFPSSSSLRLLLVSVLRVSALIHHECRTHIRLFDDLHAYRELIREWNCLDVITSRTRNAKLYLSGRMLLRGGIHRLISRS